MSKKYNSSLARPKSLDNPESFSDYCAGIGYYSLRQDYAQALSLVNTALGKFPSAPCRYRLLTMAGNCQKNQGLFSEAEPLFRQALESAYEPAHAEASLGLAECALSKGDVAGAEKLVTDAISAAQSVLSSSGDAVAGAAGTEELSIAALPLSPGGIAIKAAAIFDRHAQPELSDKILASVVASSPVESPRTAAFLARRNEQSDPSASVKIYADILSRPLLATRDVEALNGLLRLKPDISTAELDALIAKFRPVAVPAALFAVLTSLRTSSRPEWKSYAERLVGMSGGERFGKKNTDSVFLAEALKMLSRDAEINRDWTKMSSLAEKTFGVKGVTAKEKLSSVKKIAKSSVLSTGTLDQAKVDEYCSQLQNPAIGKYSVARAMMEVDENELAQEKFSEFLSMSQPVASYNNRARFNLAECYTRSGQDAKALGLYNELASSSDLDPKFALIAASKSVEPLLKSSGGSAETYAQITKLIEASDDYNSLLDMARIMRKSGGVPEQYQQLAYQKGRELALEKINSSKDPKVTMRILFQLGRRMRDLVMYEDFLADYRNLAADRLAQLSAGGPSYWEYGAYVYEIMSVMGRPVEASAAWDAFLASSKTKPSGVDLSHYQLFKSIVELNKGKSSAKEGFAKVIELAPLHLNASRAYYWLSLLDKGAGRIESSKALAARGLESTGAQGGYVWQQRLRKKLSVLAADFDVERAALGKNQVAAYRTVASEVMTDLQKLEKLNG